jgi:cysteinyl-tRNA synthetase
VLHDSVRRGNTALAAADADAVRVAFDEVVAMVDVLGLNPWAQPWASGTSGTPAGRETEVIDALVQVVLAQRQDARARKDFAAADAIRDGLDRIGIRVEDTPQGVRWSLDD